MMGMGLGLHASASIWMSVWVIGLVAMIWLIVQGERRRPADDAEAILRARFARGEIDAEEFGRVSLVLGHGAGSTR